MSDTNAESGYCYRCGDNLSTAWSERLCDPCLKLIQHEKLRDGVLCSRCDGRGRVHSSICDIQRAMNGRDRRCPECSGSGRVGWEPDREDVHPDLRTEVMARVE